MTAPGRPRTSTLVLIGLFLGVLALYVLVQPVSDTSGSSPPAATSSPAAGPVHQDHPHAHRASSVATPTKRPRPTPSGAPSPSPGSSPSGSPSASPAASPAPSR